MGYTYCTRNFCSVFISLVSSFWGKDRTQLALQTGSAYLKFMGWFFLLIGLKMVTDGLLRGAGDMKMFTIANLANFIFHVSFAIILTPCFGIAMVRCTNWMVYKFHYFLCTISHRKMEMYNLK